MPRLAREEGVEIHWAQRGDGPTVVLAPHWSGVPEVFDPLIEALVADHRVARYDARGTGESTRTGPHDMETGAGDLEAVVEAVGGPAVLIGIADAASFAANVGARRPDLVAAVVAIAGAPVSREMFLETDAMVGSDAVPQARLHHIEEGIVSRPDVTAELVRTVAAPLRTGA